MRIHEIIGEMTVKAEINFDRFALNFVNQQKDIWDDLGTHIGDIEKFKIKQYGIMYSLWDGDKVVACASLSEDTIPLVDHVWVDEDYRGQKLYSKLLWFFKTRLGHSRILLGDTHSRNMQEIVVNGLSGFTKSWYSTETGENEPFDKNSLDKYYSDNTKPTEWRVMLENFGTYQNWPKFSGNDFIRDHYDWQIK